MSTFFKYPDGGRECAVVKWMAEGRSEKMRKQNVRA
jgi:hypothetical protein